MLARWMRCVRLLVCLPFGILGTILAVPVYVFDRLSDGVWWLTEAIAGETFDA